MRGRRTNPDDAFGRIVESLHRATRDDALWPETAALIEEACGAVGSGLVVGERAGGADRIHFARFLYRGEDRPELTRAYFEDHYPHDTGMRNLMVRPEGKLFHLPELFSEDERQASPVYNEGWRSLRARNGLYAHFDDPDGLRHTWGVGDPVGGEWGAGQVELIERVLPHIRQFVAMRQALAAAGALGAGLAGLLENDRIGIVQLDRGGRVLEANAPALEILRRGDGLADRKGVLHASLPADDSRLRRLLGRALPELWGAAPAGGSMTVQRPAGRSRLGLHVSPVGVGTADFGGRRVAALVLVVDPANRGRIDARRVAALLGLTESEARVSALLAEGMKVREIAAETGFQESYVRWLFQQVYGKLGATGQVALVRQVLAVDALPRG